MKILIQLPEGLKNKAHEYANEWRKKGYEVIVSGSKSYGACDVAYEEADAIGAEKIVHYGHAPFPIHPVFKERYRHIDVEYVEYTLHLSEEDIIRITDFVRSEGYKKPILSTTIQYVHDLPKLSERMSLMGMTPLLGRGIRTVYPGQVLGCDTWAVKQFKDKGDVVLFIGGGRFHYLVLDAGLPVLVYNPGTKEVKDVSDDVRDYRKKREASVVRASEGESFGILVSTRAGQFNPDAASEIQKRLINSGKRAEILVSREVDFEALLDFNLFDAFINTACPRIADDWRRIGKPIVNIDELELFFRLLNESG